jgi:hypothetical protein
VNIPATALNEASFYHHHVNQCHVITCRTEQRVLIHFRELFSTVDYAGSLRILWLSMTPSGHAATLQRANTARLVGTPAPFGACPCPLSVLVESLQLPRSGGTAASPLPLLLSHRGICKHSLKSSEYLQSTHKDFTGRSSSCLAS